MSILFLVLGVVLGLGTLIIVIVKQAIVRRKSYAYISFKEKYSQYHFRGATREDDRKAGENLSIYSDDAPMDIIREGNTIKEKVEQDEKTGQLKYPFIDDFAPLIIASGLCFGLSLAIFCLSIPYISNVEGYNQKIDMYEKQNAKIEKQINTIVKDYQNYESDTFKTTTKNSIEIISLYPELKSDKLVSKQIGIYSDNNVNITSLKSKIIDEQKKQWWINFRVNYNKQ